MREILIADNYIPSASQSASINTFQYTTEWYTEGYKHIHVESPKDTGKTYPTIVEILLPIMQACKDVKIGVFRQVFATMKTTFHASFLKA